MVDISRALKIQGWMGEEELTWLAERASEFGLRETIVEVGSWLGRSAVALAANTRAQVVCVDHWQGSDEHNELLKGRDPDWLYQKFCENTRGLLIESIRLTSEEAARMIRFGQGRVSMVFLDASHDYDSAKPDIENWLPLIRNGGLLCGHDYRPAWPGVIQAVDELVPERKLVEPLDRCAIWWWRKNR